MSPSNLINRIPLSPQKLIFSFAFVSFKVILFIFDLFKAMFCF